MKTNIKISSNPETNWKNNLIQFPRLIAELEAAGAFTPAVMETLSESMDLSVKEIGEVVERAQNTWDKIKSNI